VIDWAPLLAGAALGAATGWLLVPLTGRALAAALARSSDESSAAPLETAPSAPGSTAAGAPRPSAPAAPPLPDPPGASRPRVDIARWPRGLLAVVSGALPAYVLEHVGWSSVALPPIVLLLGLVQLAYCDHKFRLLPRTAVHALTGAVVVSGIVVAGAGNEWTRLRIATLGGIACFVLLFAVNLLNPRWLAFGDVRLSFAVGFGLAWVSPVALLEGFLVANLLAAAVGTLLIALRRADRGAAMPFGLYLGIGTALVLLTWS
jgi:leader peptidase (prepilin peptidase)/N-methyltransferase